MRLPWVLFNIETIFIFEKDSRVTYKPPSAAHFRDQIVPEVGSHRLLVRSSGTSVVDVELPRSASGCLVIDADGSSQVYVRAERGRSRFPRMLAPLAGIASIFGALFGSIRELL